MSPASKNNCLTVALALLVILGSACGASGTGGQETEPRPADLLPNGVLQENGILTGGQPTLNQLQAIRKAGFRTVIDLRLAKEGGTGRSDIEAAGMAYAALPTAGAAGMTEANARALADLLEQSEHPVVVHCKSGNRVGGLLALKAFYVDGASPQEALRIGLDAGMTRTEPAVRKVLGLPAKEG
jgi:uncharacterized protein (TIGR01244 family)